MDGRANKQSSSAPTPSFAVDLFGPKDSSNSSAGFFGSIFGPQTSMVPGRDHHTQSYANAYGNAHRETTQENKSVKGNTMKKLGMNSSYDENKKSNESCYYDSSIYYGGQDTYSPTTNPPQNFKKDGGNADQNESNSSASRGNWWKGSLYY